MIDELLGRAELKARIEELEEERESLAAQLEAEQDRRREAVRDRQNAQERVNRLEDRVEQLSADLDRLRDGEGAGGTDELRLRGRESVGPDRASAILERLASVETGSEGALSAAVETEVPGAVSEAFGERVALVRRVAPAVVYTDDAGLVSVALSVPLPPEPFCEWGEGFVVDHDWVRPTGRTLFVLVRSDSFAAGVYDDGDRVAFDRFSTDVMSEHDKGGFSQARFERRREEEIADHVGRADDRLRALTDDREPDRTILVGQEEIVAELREYADHTDTADATGSDEDALQQAFRDFWTTQIALL